LMSDRTLAAQLAAENPNLTWEQIVASNQAKGLTGGDLYNAIIATSTRSRSSVNEALGIDPDNPSPLPPVHPPIEPPPVDPPPTAESPSEVPAPPTTVGGAGISASQVPGGGVPYGFTCSGDK